MADKIDKNIASIPPTRGPGKATGTRNDVLAAWDVDEWNKGRLDGIKPISGAAYTLIATDEGQLLIHTHGSAATLTIPTDATMPDWPIRGRVQIMREGAGVLTIAPVSGTVTLRDAGRPKPRVLGAIVTLIKIGANKWALTGDAA